MLMKKGGRGDGRDFGGDFILLRVLWCKAVVLFPLYGYQYRPSLVLNVMPSSMSYPSLSTLLCTGFYESN